MPLPRMRDDHDADIRAGNRQRQIRYRHGQARNRKMWESVEYNMNSTLFLCPSCEKHTEKAPDADLSNGISYAMLNEP